MRASDRHNPFYILLILTSLLFVATVLATALVPWLEERALAQGVAPPPSELRDLLRREGWTWLLVQVAAMIVFGLLSMVLDHRRRLRDLAESPAPPDSPPG